MAIRSHTISFTDRALQVLCLHLCWHGAFPLDTLVADRCLTLCFKHSHKQNSNNTHIYIQRAKEPPSKWICYDYASRKFICYRQKVSGCWVQQHCQVKNIPHFSAFYANHFSLLCLPFCPATSAVPRFGAMFALSPHTHTTAGIIKVPPQLSFMFQPTWTGVPLQWDKLCRCRRGKKAAASTPRKNRAAPSNRSRAIKRRVKCKHEHEHRSASTVHLGAHLHYHCHLAFFAIVLCIWTVWK